LVVDVLVIGAGPSGAAAATVLARSGKHVVVVDKASFPRDKCCGDGLTTLALRELEGLGVQPAAIENWQTVSEVMLRSPSGRHVTMRLPGDGIAAATTPRRELDLAVIRNAQAAGATLIDGLALATITPTPAGITATLTPHGRDADAQPHSSRPSWVGREIRAGFVVAADGVWSPTRKLLGLSGDGYRGEWHAFRQYAHRVTGPAADQLIVWFEPDLLPGYAWSFPLPGGRANIGFGVLRDGQRRIQDMAGLWRDLLARPHIAAALGDGFELEGRHTAWPIPCGITAATLTRGRVLFVGDAARAGDVMTGEGIGQALVTGRLAAEAILAGGSADQVAARYSREVRHDLFADHRMSVGLNKLLARPWAARGAIRVIGLSDWTRRNFARWMFEDEPRAILATPRRWHRRILRRSMPFARAKLG